ncbi:DUF2637 domain-containing protein [Nonomuraea roseoviolacea]|uniref:DUF2637 domain-containing protein n=1 Tax=Nonomuraea roseoviolacea subsp. carminata TaxID=160689 RepID=A0ABT1JX69_9ACTN|nr:DUF2637 domain-containing protein [Nonomuraea roseoviolacea]MCP2346351.1 hypothetical protein [Nonomuraea roseoviolacea subsp. carminata]
MDVTPPSTLRRLGIALAGVAVAALTGAACALSFDDLRSLAELGDTRADLAYLYPAAFDALLVVALISLLLLRSARLLVRIQTAIVLVVLLVAAAAANVSAALGLEPDVRQAAVGVAVAPWVMLAVALWLWLLLIKHVQNRRSVRDDDLDDDGDERDLVPFPRGRALDAPPPLSETPPLTEPLEQVLEPTPVVGPTPAPETPPISERVTRRPAPEPTASEVAVAGASGPVGSADVSDEAVTPSRAWAQERERERERQGSAVPGAAREEAVRAEAAQAEAARAEAARAEAARAEAARAEAARIEEARVAAVRAEADASREGASSVSAGAGTAEAGPVEDSVATDAATPDAPSGPRQETSEQETSRREAPRQEASQPEARPRSEAPRQEPARRPVRWGDRVKPTDVLVHPRTPAGKDADTQPVPVVTDDRPAAPASSGPDPAHGREAADPGEPRATAAAEKAPAGPAHDGERDESMVDTAPHPVIHEEPVEAYDDPPGRRVRSTPLPPEE